MRSNATARWQAPARAIDVASNGLRMIEYFNHLVGTKVDKFKLRTGTSALYRKAGKALPPGGRMTMVALADQESRIRPPLPTTCRAHRGERW